MSKSGESPSLPFSDFKNPKNPDRLLQALLAPAALVGSKFCPFPSDREERHTPISRITNAHFPVDKRFAQILDTLASLSTTEPKTQVVAVTAELDDTNRTVNAWISISGNLDEEQRENVRKSMRVVWIILGDIRNAVEKQRAQLPRAGYDSPENTPDVLVVTHYRFLVWRVAVHGWRRWRADFKKGYGALQSFLAEIDDTLAEVVQPGSTSQSTRASDPEPTNDFPMNEQETNPGSTSQSIPEGTNEPALNHEEGDSDSEGSDVLYSSQVETEQRFPVQDAVPKLKELSAYLKEMNEIFQLQPDRIAKEALFDLQPRLESGIRNIFLLVRNLLSHYQTPIKILVSQYNSTRKAGENRIDLIRIIKKKSNLGEHLTRLFSWASSTRMGFYLEYNLSATSISDESKLSLAFTQDEIKATLRAALGNRLSAEPKDEQHILDGASSPANPHVHAEMVQVDFHAKRAQSGGSTGNVIQYIGVSKLGCYPCKKYIGITNQIAGNKADGVRTVAFYTRGYHLKVYHNWMSSRNLPDIFVQQKLHEKLSDSFVSDFRTYWPKFTARRSAGSNPRSDDSAASGLSRQLPHLDERSDRTLFENADASLAQRLM